MREIKFQVFIEKDGKIEKYSCGVFNNEIIIPTNIPYVGQAFVKLTSQYGKIIGLRQYTGLKDKNGKEIYEGDIISTDLSRPYLVVEFRNGGFMYQCHDGGQDYYDFMLPVDAETQQDMYSEVIGNIYEHPHLLEVQHD